MEIQKFNPTKAEIQKVVAEVENLTIKGINDEVGYEAVKSARKRLGDYRIKITKFGKEQRNEAIKWQREVLRQEKELLMMIEPTEIKLKNQLETIDEQKKIEERMVLLPVRVKMLEEIEMKLSDAEILRMDEKEFSAYFSEKKLEYLEKQDQIRKAEELEKKRLEELEKAKKEAAEKAKQEAEKKAEQEKAEAERKAKEDLERVEREKQEAIEKIKREQEEKERREREEIELKKQEEEEKIAKEKAEAEKIEKNKKYQDFLKKNNYSEETDKIERNGNTITLYRKIDQITI